MEPNESPVEAAQREVLEELRMKCAEFIPLGQGLGFREYQRVRGGVDREVGKGRATGEGEGVCARGSRCRVLPCGVCACVCVHACLHVHVRLCMRACAIQGTSMHARACRLAADLNGMLRFKFVGRRQCHGKEGVMRVGLTRHGCK